MRLLGLALLFLVSAPPAHAQDAQAIIGRSARVYRALRNLTADFVQVINNPMIDSAQSKGTLVQSGPAKLAMRFSDPPGEAIVIDGEHVWVYTPSTVPNGGPVYGYNLLAWFLDRPSERYQPSYVRTEQRGGHPVDVIQLVPTVPDMPFSKAVIWLDQGDGLPRRLEIQEESGAQRTLDLSHIRVNQSLPESTFSFKVPKGVRVVDQ